MHQVADLVYTRADLEALGLVENPHMWIGSGWLYCPTCKRYAYSYAMSPGRTNAYSHQLDCYMVCRDCNTHHARFPIQKED